MHVLFWALGGALAGWLAAVVLRGRIVPALVPHRFQPGGEEFQHLGPVERAVLKYFVARKHVTKNLNTEFEQKLTLGQRIADRVAAFGGSWTFIILFLVFMAIWMLVNGAGGRAFDPFPFILLNLVLSCMAALQAPVIMMSQNRQAAKDRLDAQNDYEINLKAEMEIVSMHIKLDELREGQWSALLALQERQLRLLETLLQRVDGRESGRGGPPQG